MSDRSRQVFADRAHVGQRKVGEYYGAKARASKLRRPARDSGLGYVPRCQRGKAQPRVKHGATGVLIGMGGVIGHQLENLQTDDAAMVSWTATGAMLQGVGTLVGALAVIGAAIIGSRTFDSWRRQKIAERHIEQAERILTATYKVRRGLSYVRSPAMWSHETDAAEEQLRASGEWEKSWGGDDAQKRLATAQAYYNRLNRTNDDRRALEECQAMARAFFGEELEKAIEKLNSQFWSVKVYVDANLRAREGADDKFRRKIESTIWEGWPSTEENEVDQIIAAQVTLIEDICLPVLRMEDAKTVLNRINAK